MQKSRWQSYNKDKIWNQIKDLRLVIPKDYTFMASNTIFIVPGIKDIYPEKTTQIKLTLPPGSYKTFLDTSPPPNHCHRTVNKPAKLKTS